MSDTETIAVYDARAQGYRDLTKSDAADQDLTAFIADCLPGFPALDLGCGPGHAARDMARAGLVVEALDASAEMTAIAATHPGVNARQGKFDAVDGDDIYGGVWANFSLLHAPRSEMPAHLARLCRSLRPGGAFHIGMKTGTGSARDALGRLYTYYTETELRGLLGDAGIEVRRSRTGNSVGLDGTSAPWITLGGTTRG